MAKSEENQFVMAEQYADGLNPITAYLAPLKPVSQRSLERALIRAAGVLAPDVPIDLVAWHTLTSEAVTNVRDTLAETLMPGTVNVILCAIRGVIRASHDLGLTKSEASHEALEVSGLSNRHNMCGRVLTDDEVKCIVSACDTDTYIGCRDAAVVALFFGCALRNTEASAVNVDDVDVANGTLTIRGGASRTFSVPSDAMAYLRKWVAKRKTATGPLIVSVSRSVLGISSLDYETANAEQQRVSSCGTILTAIARRAGVEGVSVTDARCTAITRLFAAGVHELEIHRFTGHAEIDTTLKYAITDPASVHAAAIGVSIGGAIAPGTPRMNLAMLQQYAGLASAKSLAAYYRGPKEPSDAISKVSVLE